MNTPPYNDVNVNGTTLDTSIMNERSSLKTAYMFSIGTLIALAIVLIPVGTSNIYPSVQYVGAGVECLEKTSPNGVTTCTRKDLSDTCKNTPAQCTQKEKDVMLELIKAGIYNTPDSLPAGDPNSCGWWNMFACVEYAWNKVVTTIAFIPASIGAAFLIISGHLFNYSIDHTVIQFKESIFSNIEEGVNTAWEAFRDVANIVIIGMFAFIAISLILGIKEYGERRMIARVLIIAVLINFSLLFTKMIIDASNFTAYQFYKAAPITIASASGSVSTEGDIAAPGFAGSFLKAMGATNVGDLFNALEKQQESKKGSWYGTILFGLLTGVLFLLAAIVMLYGAFLLLARALLFIFLMIISPVAFASWLIPKFSQQGWSMWWDTLLKNAVFAPLLMIMLWASLKIAKQFQTTGGTIGSLVGNPGDGIGIGALFNYIIILGMLFLSIKLASKFSSTIAGFSMASSVMATPFTRGARLAGATLSRFAVGPATYGLQKRLTGKAKEARDQSAEARVSAATLRREGDVRGAKRMEKTANKFERRADSRVKWAERAGAVAGSRLNVMNTQAAKTVTAGMGITGFAAGASSQGAKSYSDNIKARAAVAEKSAAKLAPSSEERKLMEERVRMQREDGYKTRQLAEKNAKMTFEAVRSAMDGEKTQIQSQLNTVGEEAQAARMRGEDAKIKEATEKASKLQEQLAKLTDKKFTVNVDGKKIETSHKEAGATHSVADKELIKYREETSEQINKMTVAMQGAAENIAEKIGKREGTVLEKALGAFTGANTRVGQETRDLYKKRQGTARLRSVFESMKEESSPVTPPSNEKKQI